MRRLVAPDWDAFDDYQVIVDRSNHPARHTRETLRPQIKQQYEKYHKAAPEVGSLTSVVEGERACDHMRGCYGHSHIVVVKARILARQPAYLATHCQFCGGMGLVNVWDHYLPHSRLPDFSACAYNLVPICRDCNDLKLDKGTIGDTRDIIHAFYDDIPEDLPYLKADITVPREPNTQPHVSFEPCMPAQGDEQFFALYSRQFEALHLEERFAAYYNIELGRISWRISENLQNGLEPEDIRASLMRAAQREPGGPSSPLAALLRAAADSDELLEYARRGATR